MNFNKHFDLEGKHAVLSASSWRWLYDDVESLTQRLGGIYAPMIGTILHEVAYKHIKYRIKLNKYDKKNVMLELLTNGIPGLIIDTVDFDTMFETLMSYVNDGVGFKMEPEVVLKYSNNCFGTTDAIKFLENDHFLRIHDYKSGVSTARVEQLLIYAALFCLEYKVKPTTIKSELRIYQNGNVMVHNPEAEELISAMDVIINHDKFITNMKEV